MSTPLDPSKYFSDPKLIAFVDDVQRGNLADVQRAIAGGINVNAEGAHKFRPVFFALLPKDTAVLKALLAAGAKPDARLENGDTVLRTAVRLPTAEYTAVLLDAGVDPNTRGENDKPAIHDAINAEVPATIRLLAKHGADINVVWGGDPPLIAALLASEWTMATVLLELGADTSYKDRLNRTAESVFCRQVSRITPVPKNKAEIPPLAKAFADRGVHLSCEAELGKFR